MVTDNSFLAIFPIVFVENETEADGGMKPEETNNVRSKH